MPSSMVPAEIGEIVRGIIGCDRTRAPFGPVSPRVRRGLIDLAAARDLLIMRWAR